MLLDHVSFHTEEDYPVNLSSDAAATHMGYYWSWAVRQQFNHPRWDDFKDLDLVKNMTMSGAEFVLRYMNGGIEDTDFNEEGRQFSLFYYDDEEEGYGRFMEDYVITLNTPSFESFYHIPITMEHQLRLDHIFDQRLNEWRQSLRSTQTVDL